MSAPRLVVAVPAALTRLSPRGGHGRVWRHTLAELAHIVDLRAVENEARAARRRWPGRRVSHRPPDVWLISGHEPPPPAVMATDTPAVAEVHEVSWTDAALSAFLDPRMTAALVAGTDAALARAEHVVALSEASRRQVLAAYPRPDAQVVAVAPGVDGNTFWPGRPGGLDHVADALGLWPGLTPPPYVLFVGVIHPRKNLPALREAMATLNARGHPHVLAVLGSPAGDRDDSSALLAAARAGLPGLPGRIAFMPAGDLSDGELAGLMAGAAAFCLPSLWEGFGLPALEAMACGVPVVVSDRGALPEVVGDAGVIVAPDAAALTQALDGILSSPVRTAELGAAGSRRALDFSWPATAAGWSAVLHRAAGG